MRILRVLWLCVLAAQLVGVVAGARAQGVGQGTEYEVKAAFVCKFGSYVEWPPQAFERTDSALTIAVLGSNLVFDEMARAAASQRSNGRPLAVRRLGRGGDSLHGVHIVFIARSHAAQLADALKAAKGLPVLIVTESDQAIEAGSMINFVVAEDRVRFDVAVHAAEMSNLRISARLLSVARRVNMKPT